MIEFADKQNLIVELVYYPPYHSKYNRIERCWSALERHWNGTQLRTLDKAVGWAKSMTWNALSPIVGVATKLYTLVELECWDSPKDDLVDRSSSPWDNPARRPSHADRCRLIRAKMLAERFSIELGLDPNHLKIKPLFDELLALAS